MRSILTSISLLTCTVALGLTACTDDTAIGVDASSLDDAAVVFDGGEGGVSDSASSGDAAVLTEPQVVAVLEASNNGEIDEGNAVKGKTLDPRVTQLAAEFVSHHAAANDSVRALGIAPDPSATDAVALQSDSSQALITLGQRTGAELDLLYVSLQVTTHQNVLNLINTKLLPSAQTPSLQAAVISSRDMVQMHLQMATALQAALSDGGAGEAGLADGAVMDATVD